MKCIIVTTQRSGSNFLRHCLNSHPDVYCDAELMIGGQLKPPEFLQDFRTPAKISKFIKTQGWKPVAILENFLQRDDKPVVAFKVMYNQLWSPAAREFLRSHTDIRIIHLRRENLLKQYVSKALLGKKRTRRWQPHTTEKVPVVSTNISVRAAIREMERVQKKFDEYENLLCNHKKLVLTYERIIEGKCIKPDIAQQICELLEIDNKPLCSEFIKMNPDSLSQIISNYDEVESALRNTPYAQYLN